MRTWEALPDSLRLPQVRPYWESLYKKRRQLLLKRLMDLLAALVLLLPLSVPLGLIALAVKLDSKGPVFFRQERVTAYGRLFRIHKFRTMAHGAEGSSLTLAHDARITRTGAFLRRYRLDELPQIFDVICGDMSFVGTRPEVPGYVQEYQPEYLATLLLPAGITSEASIRFLDEEKLLAQAQDVDKVYLEQVLPRKMEINLESLRRFGLWQDAKTLVRTAAAVFGREG